MAESGYSSCKCPDCFEIAISNDIANPDLCGDCEEAGCDGEGECQCVPDYEPCEGCGFDHEYEHIEAQAAHERIEANRAGRMVSR